MQLPKISYRSDQVKSSGGKAASLRSGVRTPAHQGRRSNSPIEARNSLGTRKAVEKQGGVLESRLVLENFLTIPRIDFSEQHGGGSQTDGLDALITMVPLTLHVDAAVKSYATTELPQFGGLDYADCSSVNPGISLAYSMMSSR
jgi:hypothetical protein